MKIELRAVEGIPEVHPGDDLGALIAAAARLRAHDIVVVAQKVVSKSEGRLRDLRTVDASERAIDMARRTGADPRLTQVILDEAARVIRAAHVLIVETRHGFVCANAGVDRSNVPAGTVSLLPVDPDASAAAVRARVREVSGAGIGVIISDTFGRAWRTGLCNVALGVAGTPATLDHRGEPDDFGRPLTATVVAVADELAAAAGLVMGKSRRIPAVVVRGLDLDSTDPPGSGRDLVRPRKLDLFR